MLERISEIEGIGLLHKANGKPYTCLKATLVYADNGRGKSTLATVLRSASTGDGSLIANRKTVDGTLAPRVVLQFGSGHQVSFNGGVWSERRAEVLVFDADFVERNVHSGGSVSTGHRKNLLEFALGEAAVTARTAVEKASGEAKVATDTVHTLNGQISGHHVGMLLSEFEKLPQVADADVQIDMLQKRISAAGNVAAVLAKGVPSVVPEPDFDLASVFVVLEMSLEDVHADAEQIVRSHVAKLGGNMAEGWLNQGKQFGNSESCPYCGQETSDNDLIRAYQTHFNATYAALKAKVAALHTTVSTATASSVIDVFAQGAIAAAARAEVWDEHVSAKPISFDAESARSSMSEIRSMMLELCRRKQASPAEPMVCATELDRANALWFRLLAPMREVNEAINAAGALISDYKRQLKADNVQQLQQSVQLLQTSKRRHGPIAIDLLSKLADARTAAEAAETEKKRTRDELDTLMTATLARYEQAINALLIKFGTTFSIKGMGANFRGAAPRSEYGLLLRGKDVSLEGGPPSFATALSEGDRRTLAFAFFIASTLADPNLSTKTVVVDDPMCSLDSNRKQHTRATLRKIHSMAEQLVVLAHDPYFIRGLRDALRKENSAAPISLFQLALAPGEYTDFAAFDVDEECESAYFRHHRLLSTFVAGKGGDASTVAKAIRPMLEGYLHRRFPGVVPHSLMFGDAIAYIRAATPPSPLCHAQNLLDDLTEINEYAKQFHHDADDTVVVTAKEVEVFANHALRVIHQGA